MKIKNCQAIQVVGLGNQSFGKNEVSGMRIMFFSENQLHKLNEQQRLKTTNRKRHFRDLEVQTSY